jgi:hypothetical protein
MKIIQSNEKNHGRRCQLHERLASYASRVAGVAPVSNAAAFVTCYKSREDLKHYGEGHAFVSDRAARAWQRREVFEPGEKTEVGHDFFIAG